MAEPEHGDVGERGRRGGAGTRVEQRQLAEHLTLAHDREQRLAPIARGVAELDLAFGHDVEAVAGVAFREQHIALEQAALLHGGLERGRGLDVERSKQWCAHEHVVHGSSLSSPSRAGEIGEGQCVLSGRHARQPPRGFFALARHPCARTQTRTRVEGVLRRSSAVSAGRREGSGGRGGAARDSAR